ncbi:hypothetical protein N9D31_00675 [Oligoflexaceae bacterium]|nr:hypothetical protein [Oligoflexaceae bacterium]
MLIKRILIHSIVLLAMSILSCSIKNVSKLSETTASVESFIPATRLNSIRNSLPKVAYPKLTKVLQSNQTFWYDEHVMTRSYQDSVGANPNSKWPERIALGKSDLLPLYDYEKKRFEFPFATTAGTDDSDNLQVINFMHLPTVAGKPLPIPIWTVKKNADRDSWMWMYPIGTVMGEVLFIKNGEQLLPTEIRIRQRYDSGWAANAFRPFPTAQHLIEAIQKRRPQWKVDKNLVELTKHLENNQSLTAKHLSSPGYKDSFDQEGAVDMLPDFADPSLVTELLTSTVFKSSYGMAWKKNAELVTFAPSTKSALSIVPRNYDAGMIEVNDVSCARCHAQAGKRVSNFNDALYLYGEMWGKDKTFSFHPFDENEYDKLRSTLSRNTAQINPRLEQLGLVEMFDETKHKAPYYRDRSQSTVD